MVHLQQLLLEMQHDFALCAGKCKVRDEVWLQAGLALCCFAVLQSIQLHSSASPSGAVNTVAAFYDRYAFILLVQLLRRRFGPVLLLSHVPTSAAFPGGAQLLSERASSADTHHDLGRHLGACLPPSCAPTPC